MSEPAAQNPQTHNPPAAPRPQEADATQTVPTTSTQHLPDHATDSAWTTLAPGPEHQPTPGHRAGTAEPATEPAPAATPVPAPNQQTPPYQGYQRPPWHQRQQVTYLPAPTGPNWGLVVVGLVFGLVGVGVVANQVAGFQVTSLSELAPSVLVVAGLACALLGLVGIVTRRRRG